MITCKKPASLIFAQVDHLSGELLGDASQQLADEESVNVRFLPMLTKKSRPGHILLIDTSDEKREKVESFLVNDLGISGWHRIPTEHVYVKTEIIKKRVIVKTKSANLEVDLWGKKVINSQAYIRPEYESCAFLRKILYQELNFKAPLRELQRKIAEAMNSQDAEPVIDLNDLG